ncbi:unnamed protein product [Effrenium voratum]|nr:unnamed protein product [Effrenium voratum]
MQFDSDLLLCRRSLFQLSRGLATSKKLASRLRATFFAVDELVKLFTLLPYAVSVILIFIGTKLVLRGWIHIPAEVVCMTLVGVLLVSMAASMVYDRFYPKDDDEDNVKPYVSPVSADHHKRFFEKASADDTDA